MNTECKISQNLHLRACLLVCLLPMVSSAAIGIDVTLEVADFTREYCRSYLAPDPVELENLTSGYQTLNKKHIARAMAEVPSQLKYQEMRGWSCSQGDDFSYRAASA